MFRRNKVFSSCEFGFLGDLTIEEKIQLIKEIRFFIASSEIT